jgi:hypothetical protein
MLFSTPFGIENDQAVVEVRKKLKERLLIFYGDICVPSLAKLMEHFGNTFDLKQKSLT